MPAYYGQSCVSFKQKTLKKQVKKEKKKVHHSGYPLPLTSTYFFVMD